MDYNDDNEDHDDDMESLADQFNWVEDEIRLAGKITLYRYKPDESVIIPYDDTSFGFNY